MDSATVVVLIPATIVFLLTFFFFTKKTAKSPNLPPGSSGFPLIGETLSFLKPYATGTTGKFMETRISRYGKIFSSNLLRRKTIVSADAKFSKFVLKNEMKLFVSGWPPSFNDMVGKGSLPATIGEAHKKKRSIMVDFLSTERVQTVFLEDADRLASLIISSWKEDSVIFAHNEATKFSLYVIANEMLSIKPEDPEIEIVQREYYSYARGFVCFPINFPGTEYRKALKAKARIFKLIERKMQKRKEKKENDGNEDDFLDWLIKRTEYPSEEIKDFVLSTFFGGHDTTARAISFMLYLLQGNPKAMEKLREEHLQIVESKKDKEPKLSWDDFKAMEFTHCVINETLRLGNIAHFVQKKTIQDIQFKGFDIPQGYSVMLHINSMHLDPSFYENAENFNPWRWLEGSFGVKNIKDFMPFGGGIRRCPGAELTKMKMAVFLHHVVLNFNWELAETCQPMNHPLIRFPKSMPIKIHGVKI